MAQYHFRARPTPKLLDEVSVDRAMAFYKDRFADASDFTFSSSAISSLRRLNRWSKSISPACPRKTGRNPGKRLACFPPKGIINKEVYRGQEPKSSVRINCTGPFEWSQQNRYDFNSLLELLNIRLRGSRCEERSPGRMESAPECSFLYPHPRFNISVSWGCDPARVELVKNSICSSTLSVSRNPTKVYVDKVKEITAETIR